MSEFIGSIWWLLVSLGVLVTFHEFGHYWVARRCGVKVLRFSVGFGKPLWLRRGRDGTEYVLAAIPLGGYVKMLDEREGEVAPADRPPAFTRQNVGKRARIGGLLRETLGALEVRRALTDEAVGRDVHRLASAATAATAAAAAAARRSVGPRGVDRKLIQAQDRVAARERRRDDGHACPHECWPPPAIRASRGRPPPSAAWLNPQAVATLEKADGDWRQVKAGGRKGWVKASEVWGAGGPTPCRPREH